MRRAPQLACVNRKIVESVISSSNAHIHAIFAEAAFLAERAIEAATELQRMPGVSSEAFAEALDFWRRVRDHAGTAALDSPLPFNGRTLCGAEPVQLSETHEETGAPDSSDPCVACDGCSTMA